MPGGVVSSSVFVKLLKINLRDYEMIKNTTAHRHDAWKEAPTTNHLYKKSDAFDSFIKHHEEFLLFNPLFSDVPSFYHIVKYIITYTSLESRILIDYGAFTCRGRSRVSWLSRKHGWMRWATSLKPVEWWRWRSLRTSRQWRDTGKNMATKLPATVSGRPVSSSYYYKAIHGW